MVAGELRFRGSLAYLPVDLLPNASNSGGRLIFSFAAACCCRCSLFGKPLSALGLCLEYLFNDLLHVIPPAGLGTAALVGPAADGPSCRRSRSRDGADSTTPGLMLGGRAGSGYDSLGFRRRAGSTRERIRRESRPLTFCMFLGMYRLDNTTAIEKNKVLRDERWMGTCRGGRMSARLRRAAICAR